MPAARAHERTPPARCPAAPQHYHYRIYVYSKVGSDGAFMDSVNFDLVDFDEENAVRRARGIAECASNEPDTQRKRFWVKDIRQCEDESHVKGVPAHEPA